MVCVSWLAKAINVTASSSKLHFTLLNFMLLDNLKQLRSIILVSQLTIHPLRLSQVNTAYFT